MNSLTTPASRRAFGRGGIFVSLLLLTLVAPLLPLRAQDAPPPDLPPLDQLLAPVALYPDPLIGLVLAASTTPSDVQAAAAYAAQGGDPNQIAAQPWSDGVKGLAHYPDVLKWMNDNMPWTQQLGAAFASQPDAVMGAVQDLRTRARASGALTSTPQQTVVTEDDAIAIEPAQPDEMYVPLYDPSVVYWSHPPGYWGGPYITFGAAFPLGIWLGYDFDWRGRRLWAGDWYTWRREHGGWGHPYDPRDRRFAGFEGHARVWSAPPGVRGNFAITAHSHFEAPRPMPGTPFHGGARPGPAFHAETAPRPGPGYHPAAAPRQGPEQRPGPAYHPAPAYHQAPEARPAPVYHQPAPQPRREEAPRAARPEPARVPERAPERAPVHAAPQHAPAVAHPPAAAHPAARPAPARRPPPKQEDHKQ